MLWSVLYFFVMSWGLGFGLTYFVKKEKSDGFERHVMRVGLGLAFFIVIGVLLDLIGLRLQWWIFLLLALIGPLTSLIVKRKKLSGWLKKSFTSAKVISWSRQYGLLMLIVIFCLATYVVGSFSYPYLENDDPWSHAEGIAYVSEMQSLHTPKRFELDYVNPYPPGYDLLMAMLLQTNDSMYWTLKFFNGLIITLGVLCFYFFAKQFTKSEGTALFATFILASLPSFFTHFIWAHTLVVLLFMPAFYAFERLKDDASWLVPTIIAVAAIPLVQPSQAIKFVVMAALYLIIRSVVEKKLLWKDYGALAGGLIVSLLWWGPKAAVLLSAKIAKTTGGKYAALEASVDGSTIFGKLRLLFPANAGTATRSYSFNDFFLVKPFGGINIHVGWGIAITLLLICALVFVILKHRQVFSKKHTWIIISLAWLLFTFLGTNSVTYNLPVGLIAFRFWLLMAIPVALLSYLGFKMIAGLFGKNNLMKLAILVIIVVAVFFTAALPKYKHNTLATWPPGVSWASGQEVQGYVWMRENLPAQSRVFSYSTNDKHAIGMDMESCFWCDDVLDTREHLLEVTNEDLVTFLKENNYDYMIVSGMSVKYLNKKFGENVTQERLATLFTFLDTSGSFQPAFVNEGIAIVQVV